MMADSDYGTLLTPIHLLAATPASRSNGVEFAVGSMAINQTPNKLDCAAPVESFVGKPMWMESIGEGEHRRPWSLVIGFDH